MMKEAATIMIKNNAENVKEDANVNCISCQQPKKPQFQRARHSVQKSEADSVKLRSVSNDYKFKRLHNLLSVEYDIIIFVVV